MGKGDKRSRRGKIFAGSFGKTRQKPKTTAFVITAKAATPEPAIKEKAKPKVRKKAAEVVTEVPATVEVAPENGTPEVAIEDGTAEVATENGAAE